MEGLIEEKVVIKPRRQISTKLRQLLLKKHNHTCVSCGISDDIVPLEMASIVPTSEGGDFSEENFTILCPNCHRSFDRQPREHEFISFLSEIINANDSYSNVQIEPLLGRSTRYRADLIVKRARETLLIECKSYLIGSMARSKNIISQLNKYKEEYGDCQMVLAVPGSLKERELEIFSGENVEVWDIGFIAHNFKQQIIDASPSYYKTLFLTQLARASKPTREEELIKSLEKCPPGRADCYVYQSLVGDILEHLFTPPLNKPIPELSDKTLANRRDFIMPNYSDKGFWAFMRGKYGADYVIIDAKNYARKVKKTEVFQMANYLKQHGAGLFGIIVSRQGGDSAGCEHTLREQWLISQKMILALSDEDIIEMLMAKSDGRPPEDVLGRKIEQFRLSM
ncbi:HNH endonuclease [Thauera sp. Sel9]|uniref:HNH endonuclease n=1 Tax=Thauera sp. Sel9 TaxID=2974299 RepID=UPI0021E107C3|nr:HNH endonuclease signature motif containing protein [Thauera sp. Sel9]MCV2218764.1 HNH endonuclease [Thauera sp. Sel9]